MGREEKEGSTNLIGYQPTKVTYVIADEKDQLDYAMFYLWPLAQQKRSYLKRKQILKAILNGYTKKKEIQKQTNLTPYAVYRHVKRIKEI